jgi:hypothetical protein
MVATMISRTRSVPVARNAGVRIKITRLGNGMPAASINDDQKTTLKEDTFSSSPGPALQPFKRHPGRRDIYNERACH